MVGYSNVDKMLPGEAQFLGGVAGGWVSGGGHGGLQELHHQRHPPDQEGVRVCHARSHKALPGELGRGGDWGE